MREIRGGRKSHNIKCSPKVNEGGNKMALMDVKQVGLNRRVQMWQDIRSQKGAEENLIARCNDPIITQAGAGQVLKLDRTEIRPGLKLTRALDWARFSLLMKEDSILVSFSFDNDVVGIKAGENLPVVGITDESEGAERILSAYNRASGENLEMPTFDEFREAVQAVRDGKLTVPRNHGGEVGFYTSTIDEHRRPSKLFVFLEEGTCGSLPVYDPYSGPVMMRNYWIDRLGICFAERTGIPSFTGVLPTLK